MEPLFDTFAKLVAEGAGTRRQALRWLGGLVGGAMLGSLGVRTRAWAQDLSCREFCALVYPPGFGRLYCRFICRQCTRTSRHACLLPLPGADPPYYVGCCCKAADGSDIPCTGQGKECCRNSEGVEVCGRPCGDICCDPPDATCCPDQAHCCSPGRECCLDGCCPPGRECCGDVCCAWGLTCCEGLECCGACCRGADDFITCCEPHQICEDGQCVDVCLEGQVHCGDDCCTYDKCCLGLQCCEGECCVHADGTATCCPPSQVCQNGACVDCPPDQVICDGVCCGPDEYCRIHPTVVECTPCTPGWEPCVFMCCPPGVTKCCKGLGCCGLDDICCEGRMCCPPDNICCFNDEGWAWCCPEGSTCGSVRFSCL
jgi:hypothetical protein